MGCSFVISPAEVPWDSGFVLFLFRLFSFLRSGRAFISEFLLFEVFTAVIGSVKTATFQDMADRVDNAVNASPAFRAAFLWRVDYLLLYLELVPAFFTRVMISRHKNPFSTERTGTLNHMLKLNSTSNSTSFEIPGSSKMC